MRKACEGPGCGEIFEAKRLSAKYCSTRCRVRANRAADRGAGDAAEGSNVVHWPGSDAAGPIAAATQSELAAAGVLKSALGQSALLAARRLDSAPAGETGAGVRALIEAHRAALSEALRAAESVEVNPLEQIRASAALKLLASG